MWNDTAITRRLGIRYPIVQGPFGGGLSSARLVAAVSNAGGLGSFGAQGMTPERIGEVVREIRALTASPFAVNLWVSTEDASASGTTHHLRSCARPARAILQRASHAAANVSVARMGNVRRAGLRTPRREAAGLQLRVRRPPDAGTR